MIGIWLDQELSKPLLRRGLERVPSKVSMILILPPQQGHGGGSIGAWD
jgi:ribosomal protein L31E